MEENDEAIAPSMLYAYAAIMEGVAYCNGAPNLSADFPALVELANQKGVAISDDTTFSGDLEFDSLTVMDFVAAIEDEFDIIISMNQQAEIETYGQLVDAVVKLQG